MKTPCKILLGLSMLTMASCAPSLLNQSSRIDRPRIYSLPQDSLCAIVGRVTEVESDRPITISNVFTIGDRHGTVTDQNGNFSLSNLTSGMYRIRATSIGHESAESVEFSLKPNQIAVLNITLLPKKPVISH